MQADCRALRSARAVIWALLAVAPPSFAQPDQVHLGKEQGYPVGTAQTWYSDPYRVGSWSAMDRVRGLRIRTVARGDRVTPLPPARQPPELRYRYRNVQYTIDEYLDHQRVTALLVLKDGQIVYERYRYGRTDQARFLSFSMAKSITSLLIGIAADKGLVASLDDTAERYAKELAGSAYGATRISDLLRMSSGLTFTERYDGRDDVARVSRAAQVGVPTVVEVLKSITDRHSPAGAVFTYASAESEVLGRVLSGATGRSVAELTSEWLWQPIGAEADAFWVLSHDGQERTSGYFNATLRDWGRVGLMLARDGRVGDRQVVPLDYLLDATDAARQPRAFRPGVATPYFGYGRQFWLFPGAARTFAFQGVHSQALFVQPASGIVMVQLAVAEAASGRQDPQPLAERAALWRGVLQSLGGIE